jgi:hypothetical protein
MPAPAPGQRLPEGDGALFMLPGEPAASQLAAGHAHPATERKGHAERQRKRNPERLALRGRVEEEKEHSNEKGRQVPALSRVALRRLN